MLTITQAFLDECPAWAAEGWQVGEQIDLAVACQNNATLQAFMNNHPIHHPNG